MLRVGSGALGALLLCSGCPEPSVAARVVWLESQADHEGEFRLRVYDAGELRSLTIRPTDPGSMPEQLLLTPTPGGRGLAVGNSRDGLLLDLDDERMLRLPEGAVDRIQSGEFAPRVWFPRAGGAFGINRETLTDDQLELGLVPLGRTTLEELVLTPPSDVATATWSVPMTATDAPVIVLVEESAGRPNGAGVVWRYPWSDADGDDAVVIGSGQNLEPVNPFGAPPPSCIGAAPGMGSEVWPLCIDPSGTTAYFAGPDPATVLGWRWAAEETTVPVALPLPGEVAPGDWPLPVAAIGPEQLVLVDINRNRVYLADLEEETLRSVPLPSRNPTLRLTNRGRTVILVDQDGTVVRVDRNGPVILSNVSTPCAAFSPLDFPAEPRVGRVVTSPGGGWVAWTCLNQGSAGYSGAIVRISALGTERVASIPMQTLAVDDDGNLLLYSVDPEGGEIGGEPRGLFVFEPNGRLHRVDGLDPTPAGVRMFAPDLYFGATGLW